MCWEQLREGIPNFPFESCLGDSVTKLYQFGGNYSLHKLVVIICPPKKSLRSLYQVGNAV